MHVSAAHQGSEPMVNQEESNDKLFPCVTSCVHCQESNIVVTKSRSRPDGTFHYYTSGYSAVSIDCSFLHVVTVSVHCFLQSVTSDLDYVTRS